jgi:hypothetical protein
MLPFNQASGLARLDLAQRLFWVSRGNIGRLTNAIYFAGCEALNDDASCIEQEHFARAYERRKAWGTTFNPFVHDWVLRPGTINGATGQKANRSPTAARLFSKNAKGEANGFDAH